MKTKPTIYTEEWVKKEVISLLADLEADPTMFFKGQLIDKRPYSLKRYSEWRRDFGSNNEISETMDKIDSIFLTRAVVGGMTSKLSPVMTKFHLVNNFGWKEKTETDITSQGQQIGVQVYLPKPNDK